MYDINKNYYKILEIEQNASTEEVRKAFITLSKKHHPDKYPLGSPEKKQAEIIFANITEAYSILSDPAHRRNYDEIRAGRMTEDGLPVQKKEPEVDWAEHYFKDGEEALRRKETDSAIKNLREAVRLKPNVAKYNFCLGLAYVEKGWHAYAKASFAAAIKIDPNNLAAKKYMSNLESGAIPPPQQQQQKSAPSSRPTPSPSSPTSPLSNIFKKK